MHDYVETTEDNGGVHIQPYPLKKSQYFPDVRDRASQQLHHILTT